MLTEVPTRWVTEENYVGVVLDVRVNSRNCLCLCTRKQDCLHLVDFDILLLLNHDTVNFSKCDSFP